VTRTDLAVDGESELVSVAVLAGAERVDESSGCGRAGRRPPLQEAPGHHVHQIGRLGECAEDLRQAPASDKTVSL
jgi:hypothetical protein